MAKFTVIGGYGSSDLAKRIARKLKATYIKTEKNVFPDGESKITINHIPKKSIVVVVQSTYPPVDTNLLELLSIVSKVQKFSSKIYTVIPYMGYARQDREFLDGEIITIGVVGKLLKASGVKKVLTVDIHSKLALKELKISSENVSAMEGKFHRFFKESRHPHTNMAKAALNMLTHTASGELAKSGIYMNAVDTGWVTDEDPAELSKKKEEVHDFQPPLDIVDGAARVMDPLFDGINTGKHWSGKFLKDYMPIDW